MEKEKVKKILITALFTFLLIGCGDGNTEEKTIYDDNGNIIEVESYKNGVLAESTKFSEDGEKVSLTKLLDQDNKIVEEYYPNGNVKISGSLYRDLKTGWWSSYDESGAIKSKHEFLIISGKEYANQSILYDDRNNIEQESIYANFNYPDHLVVGLQIIKLDYHSPYISDSQVMVCVSDSIKDDFSNINEVVLDTFYSGENKNIWFGVECNEKKSKIVRGFILEEYIRKEKDETKDSVYIMISHNKLYFDKKLPVK
ncbi:toxin-antitoxin system YwqK family antitoxin [Flavobacterium beibuense]|uniref:toxin-antitoxin system YwqK family antitoxin n=1 Tax=Flavobacterium beibuense TaxID=657326 RepID=UPI003A92380B